MQLALDLPIPAVPERRAAAAKGRETAAERNVGWGDGCVQMPGTPGYRAPEWMGKK